MKYLSNKICLLYEENNKTLTNELRELNKYKHMYFMLMDRKTQYAQGVHSSILGLYIVNAIQIKILASYFVDNNKLSIYFVQILKFTQRGKRLRIYNIILKEKNKIGWPIQSNFKTYYKAVICRTVWY